MDPTTPLTLRTGAVIVPATRFDPKTRAELDCGDDDFVISLAQSRNTSKVIDANTAALLERFRQPISFDDAVAGFSAEHGIAIEEVRDAARPLIARFLRKGFLRKEGDVAAKLGASFAHLEERDGFVFHRPLQLADDSEVYLVRRSGEWAALKVEVPGSSFTAPLEHEESILGKLGEGICPRLLGSGRIDGRRYLALEWCPGVNAAKAAAEWRVRDQRAELLALIIAIVEAYSKLHDRGVIHADVHPRNLLVLRDGTVRIIDFGLARQLDADGDGPRRAGVAYFYEPELARALLAGERSPGATEAGEQFAVAAVAYRLATGEHYCEFGIDRERLLTQVAEHAPLPFEDHGAAPWPELESVLARALSKQADERYASIADLGRALGDVRRASTAPPEHEAVGTRRAATREPRLADRFIRDAAIGGPMLDAPLAAPSASLYNGSAGIAYALCRIAMQRGDAATLAAADVWAQRALRELGDRGAIYVDGKKLTQRRLGRSSPYHTASGIHAVQALIHRARGDAPGQHVATKKFVREASRAPNGNDLAFGRSGTLTAAALLVEAGSATWREKDPGLIGLGERALEELWAEIEGLPDIAERQAADAGVAHGWAGFLYATLAWCRARGTAVPAEVRVRLDQLSALAAPYGRGIRWPWGRLPEAGKRPKTMPGWCGGSAGHVLLWSLADDHFAEPLYADLAEASAWDCWDAPRRISTLCCGLTGRAYALLHRYRASQDEVWLRRARRLAESAATKAAFYKDCPHSLFYGRTGLALLQIDLEEPAAAVFPFFELGSPATPDRWSRRRPTSPG